MSWVILLKVFLAVGHDGTELMNLGKVKGCTGPQTRESCISLWKSSLAMKRAHLCYRDASCPQRSLVNRRTWCCTPTSKQVVMNPRLSHTQGRVGWGVEGPLEGGPEQHWPRQVQPHPTPLPPCGMLWNSFVVPALPLGLGPLSLMTA